MKTKAEFEKLAIDMFGDKAKIFLSFGFESESLEEMLKSITINGIEYAIRAVGAENSKNNVKTLCIIIILMQKFPGGMTQAPFTPLILVLF